MMLEFIVDLDNMNAAMEKVMKNKGAAGVDKVTVDQLKAYYTEHAFEIRQATGNRMESQTLYVFYEEKEPGCKECAVHSGQIRFFPM